MPSREEMLEAIRQEVERRNLSARQLSRDTGLSAITVGKVLKGDESARLPSVTFLYTKLVLDRYKHDKAESEPAAS